MRISQHLRSKLRERHAALWQPLQNALCSCQKRLSFTRLAAREALERLRFPQREIEVVAGLVRMLELLEDEVERCLGLLGPASFAGIDHSYLHATTPTNLPHVFSAFPPLDIPPYRYAD